LQNSWRLLIILLISLTLVFSSFIKKNLIIFAQNNKSKHISKINYRVTAFVKEIRDDYVIVDYDIQLSPFPAGNPVIFLEYTLKLPNYIIIKHLSINNSSFAKKVVFDFKEYNKTKTFIIKPKSKKIILDSKVNIRISTFIPFKKGRDGILLAFIPSFQKINNLLKPDSFVIFQPYINTNYSVLIKFTDNSIVFKNITKGLIINIKNMASNMSLVSLGLIKFCLVRIFFSLIILYNILWTIINLRKNQK